MKFIKNGYDMIQPINIVETILDTDLPRDISIEEVYEIADENNIEINNIIWQYTKEQYGDKNNLILSHGSRSGIKGDIRLDKSGDSNDFGQGFYCGQNLQQAGMFVSEEPNSSLYIIKFNNEGLKKIAFNVSTDWMLAVAYYRDTLGEYKNHPRVMSIINEIEKADYIIAPIADNRIFELVDAFVQGDITDKQCQYALSTAYLGYQFVFKKEVCLPHLEILEHLYLSENDKAKYNASLTNEARTSLYKAIVSREKYYEEGKYIEDILN